VQAVCLLIQLYIYAILGRILLSWFPISPGSALAPVFSLLYNVTEPVLGPLRRVLPPMNMGGMGLDLSPIVFFLVAQVLTARLC
jgi:YggT family protein